MLRRPRLARHGAFVAAATSALVVLVVSTMGAGAGGCQTATEVTLELRTLGALPCTSLKGVEIVVAQTPRDAEERMKLGSFSAVVARGDCSADGHTIGTLVITPSESTGAVMVRARFSDAPDAKCEPPDYKGCIVARRSFSFIEHASLTLPISLEAACVDVPCDVESSCRSGVCVSSQAACSDGANACLSIAEPVPDKDGGVILPDEAGIVTPDSGLADRFAPPDAPFDSPQSYDGPADAPVVDAPSDSASTDSMADAPWNQGDVCPTGAGNVDCFFAAGTPVCCLNEAANGFSCVAQGVCQAPSKRYDCTGRAHCGGGSCCAGFADGSTTFTATCSAGAFNCGALGKDTICTSSADCPGTLCTKVSGTFNGRTIFACQ